MRGWDWGGGMGGLMIHGLGGGENIFGRFSLFQRVMSKDSCCRRELFFGGGEFRNRKLHC